MITLAFVGGSTKERGDSTTISLGMYPVMLAVLLLGEKPLQVLAGGHVNKHVSAVHDAEVCP